MDYKEIEERIKDRIHDEMKEILDMLHDFSLFEMIDIISPDLFIFREFNIALNNDKFLIL